MPSHTAPLLEVFPTPGNENSGSPSTGITLKEPKEAPPVQGTQEGVQKKEEEVYRWTLPAIFPNGKPLGIKETEEHCLPVFLLIILEIYKAFLPKLSKDKSRFGQNLKELDPETAQDIFDDLGREVEKYKQQNPREPLMRSKDFSSSRCTPSFAAKIVDYAYRMAIPKPTQLNTHYQSFSSGTYGETNIPMVASILKELRATEKDVFVDLGSGVGSLVTYAAARKIEAYGIEQLKVPADFAKVHAEMFDRLMDHFGKSKGKYEHYHDSFLSPDFHDLITKKATIIYLNNFAFGDELMQQIIDVLQQVEKKTTRIVTTKPLKFAREGIKRNEDSNFDSISHHKEMKSMQAGVSWTDEPIPFWKVNVDAGKYQKILFERKMEKERNEILKIEAYVKRQEQRDNAARRKQELMDSNGGVLPEAGQKRKHNSKKGFGWSKKARK